MHARLLLVLSLRCERCVLVRAGCLMCPQLACAMQVCTCVWRGRDSTRPGRRVAATRLQSAGPRTAATLHTTALGMRQLPAACTAAEPWRRACQAAPAHCCVGRHCMRPAYDAGGQTHTWYAYRMGSGQSSAPASKQPAITHQNHSALKRAVLTPRKGLPRRWAPPGANRECCAHTLDIRRRPRRPPSTRASFVGPAQHEGVGTQLTRCGLAFHTHSLTQDAASRSLCSLTRARCFTTWLAKRPRTKISYDGSSARDAGRRCRALPRPAAARPRVGALRCSAVRARARLLVAAADARVRLAASGCLCSWNAGARGDEAPRGPPPPLPPLRRHGPTATTWTLPSPRCARPHRQPALGRCKPGHGSASWRGVHCFQPRCTRDAAGHGARGHHTAAKCNRAPPPAASRSRLAGWSGPLPRCRRCAAPVSTRRHRTLAFNAR